MDCGAAPPFRHLPDEKRKACLVSLRAAVAPILANNVLPHFTNHDVEHSDRLTSLVDELIAPLQDTEHKLTPRELVVLYGTCYLHDIGLQLENAGQTPTIQVVLREDKITQRWDELSEATRRKYLRDHHNKISADMIMDSVNVSHPLVGIQLTDDFEPSAIASLARAHVIDVELPEYRELTQTRAGLRMSFLSAVFRVADILEESRHRAPAAKGRTLSLEPTAQKHWWRHRYTENVTVEADAKTITIWYDFPKNRVGEYAPVVPELQMPLIRDEFARHQAVFNRYGFTWTLEKKVDSNAFTTAEEMPDEVLTEMLKELHQRRQREHEMQQQAALRSFRAAWPHIHQRLDTLENQRSGMRLADYIRGRYKIARDMWDFGARRWAWFSFASIFEREGSALDAGERIEIGVELATMMLHDDAPDHAVRVTQAILGLADALPDPNPLKFAFWKLHATCLERVCDYKCAVEALERAMKLAPEVPSRSELEAQLAELHCLQGEFGNALTSLAAGGKKP